MAGYKVTGHCALFTADTAQGRMRVTVYRGQPVPPGATDEEIRHNLSVGLIAPTGFVPPAPVEPTPGVPPNVEADSVPFDDADRVKAREKLPADGSAPHANASEAVWVEYAVSRGHSFDAARTAGKDEIRKLFG